MSTRKNHNHNKHSEGQRRFPHKRIKKPHPPGAAPGHMAADDNAHPTSIRLISYNASDVTETANASIDDIRHALQSDRTLWIDVVGLRDVALLQELADLFAIHPLVREDIVNVHQRAKTEDYDGQLYVVVQHIRPDKGFEIEQISLLLGERYLLTFQEFPDDSLAPLRTRLRSQGGRMRRAGPDYLAYAVIDATIDAFFPALETLGDQLESLEEEVIQRPTPACVESLHRIRHQLLAMRRVIWPHREMVNGLLRRDSGLIHGVPIFFLRDCFVHAVQLMDIMETYREIASGLVDVYLSSLSNRMNEIMKVLTIIATIFIPLGFVAGIYGMNFDPEVSPWNMPELSWPFGYPLVLGLMLTAGLGMLFAFWRRGWLGRRGLEPPPR